MKKILLLFVGSTLTIFSQNTQGKADDASRIALTTYVPEQVSSLKPEAKNILFTKLNEIATKNGIGASSLNDRFILTANVIELTKDISTTTPVIYSYNLQITLYIGDGIAGTKFATHSIEVKGAGNSEIKAYISAIKNIKPIDAQYKNFIDEGKSKIIEYYNSKCDFIIKEAKMLESKNEYENAISVLLSVPEVCKECYDKCMDAVGPLYQKHIDLICAKDLMEATTQWNLTQDFSAAEAASRFLVNIDPKSKCYKDAQILNEKIAKRIKELDQREWDFMLKQQNDETEIQKMQIKGATDIAIAKAKNQPKTIIKYNIYGWW
jgi:hypothetical protein